MNALRDALAALLSSTVAERLLLGLVIVLCAIGNLPWHLDNYDQAKQAYVSYEIAHGGDWGYQHVPRGGSATKPPLAGWISLATYGATGSWDIAWRLPGFLCTLVLAALLMREARRILPDGGALLVLCAFGLNLLTPRIATLVRTDMMLTLGITVCGWLIYRKIATGTPWTPADRWLFFGAMLATLFTKGPILYAFVLPGMAAFLVLAPKGRKHLVWSGWWTWIVPLALFLAWLGHGIQTRPDFYHDIVEREFLSRFDQSLRGNERQQPIWFYFPHIIHKILPWSVLLIVITFFSQNVRRQIRKDPGLLWLACWGLGGLLCMTFVPSKRVDRIFPIIPPLCLLLVGMVAACQCGKRVRVWCGAAVVVSVLMTAGYFVTVVIMGYWDKTDALVHFGREARARAHQAGVTDLVVMDSRDEAMVIYCGADEYFYNTRARRWWDQEGPKALVMPERRLKEFGPLPAPALDSGPISKQGEGRYLLFLRPESP